MQDFEHDKIIEAWEMETLLWRLEGGHMWSGIEQSPRRWNHTKWTGCEVCDSADISLGGGERVLADEMQSVVNVI